MKVRHGIRWAENHVDWEDVYVDYEPLTLRNVFYKDSHKNNMKMSNIVYKCIGWKSTRLVVEQSFDWESQKKV